jgi:copper chaperone
MTFTIAVENIKCGGCASTIRSRLLDDGRVSAVDVDVQGGRVTVAADPAVRPELVAKLARLGYPEVGSVEGIKAAAAKAKSFVSCAVGRIDNASAE